ncbi:peptide deformylase [Sulfitobacter sp. LCG007]
MSVLPILLWPDARLSVPCAPVGEVTQETRALAADMLETMYAAPGRGLAGPQVGVLKRIFVMDVAWKDGAAEPMVFIDPDVTPLDPERRTGAEGCLSIPGVTAQVERWARVKAAWTDLDGQRREGTFDGFAAVCIQHETDHLDGIVTLDRVGADVRDEMLRAYETGSA